MMQVRPMRSATSGQHVIEESGECSDEWDGPA